MHTAAAKRRCFISSGHWIKLESAILALTIRPSQEAGRGLKDV